MSRDFDDHLKAAMERELAPAYQADDNQLQARYQASARAPGGADGAGTLLSAAAPTTRLRLAALVIVGAVVMGGAAVVEASRSSQGLIVPLLQPASSRQPAGGAPATVVPAKPAVQAPTAAPTAAAEHGRAGSVPAGAAAGTDNGAEAPKVTEPSPSPERDSGAPSEAGNRTEPTPKPSCSPPPPSSGRASPEARAASLVRDGPSPRSAAPEAGLPVAHDQCG